MFDASVNRKVEMADTLFKLLSLLFGKALLKSSA
jgi:hypothetical protein